MRVRIVGENQDESKWPLYPRRMRQGRYDSRQQQSTEIYRRYLLLQRDITSPHSTSHCARRAWRPHPTVAYRPTTAKQQQQPYRTDKGHAGNMRGQKRSQVKSRTQPLRL
jgi:hypothetical protein